MFTSDRVLPPSRLLVALTIFALLPQLLAQGATVYRIDANATSPPALHAYDVATNVWSTKAALPALNTTSLASDGRQIYALPEDGNVYTYNVAMNTWDFVMAGPPGSTGRNAISMFETLNGEFYWSRDGGNTLSYTQMGVWTTIVTPAAISSGSDIDPATGRVYIRIYGDTGVMAFHPATGTFPVNCAGGISVGENNRSGAFVNGKFYTNEWGPGMVMHEWDVAACMQTLLSSAPSTSHPSSCAGLGLIYLNGYSGTETTFEAVDPVTGVVTTLASSPSYGGNSHPALAFVGSLVDILSVDTVPTVVAPGQGGILVQVTVENLEPADTVAVGSLPLRFTGTVDRTGEYTVTPDPGNPTQIAPMATAVFDFSVDVDALASEETITVDASFMGTFVMGMTPAQAVGARMPDTWDVVGARPEVRTVSAAPAMVFQGSTHPVTVDVENVGLTDWNAGTLQMSFTGSLDRTSEYTVTPDPGNPTVISPGATESFLLSVDIDPMATPELVVLDVALFDGIDGITGRVQSDMGADVTDSWIVDACAAPFCGDCDLNQQLTVLDALKGAQIAAGLILYPSLSVLEMEQCDVDNDADVDVLDALLMAQAAAGLPVTLVCC